MARSAVVLLAVLAGGMGCSARSGSARVAAPPPPATSPAGFSTATTPSALDIPAEDDGAAAPAPPNPLLFGTWESPVSFGRLVWRFGTSEYSLAAIPDKTGEPHLFAKGTYTVYQGGLLRCKIAEHKEPPDDVFLADLKEAGFCRSRVWI